MKIGIRRAKVSEASLLTDLAFRSKQSNGYDDAFMEACREEITLTEERLKFFECWVAETDSLCGMVCLSVDGSGRTGEIENFFVDPDYKRMGIGRKLWEVLSAFARDTGIAELRLDADPFAVDFYQAIGFEIVGEAPSGSIEGRVLPHMRIVLK